MFVRIDHRSLRASLVTEYAITNNEATRGGAFYILNSELRISGGLV